MQPISDEIKSHANDIQSLRRCQLRKDPESVFSRK